jgi:hypothetical protein
MTIDSTVPPVQDIRRSVLSGHIHGLPGIIGVRRNLPAGGVPRPPEVAQRQSWDERKNLYPAIASVGHV